MRRIMAKLLNIKPPMASAGSCARRGAADTIGGFMKIVMANWKPNALPRVCDML